MTIEFPLEKKFPLGSGFGPRGSLAGGKIKAHNHQGQDIAAPTGTKVKSVADGVVVRSTPTEQSGGYGNFIVIKHDDFYSAYGHLSKREVKKGDKVKKGELIGLVGSTGQSTGPHLHFEIRKTENGSQIDPKPYLTGSEITSTIFDKEKSNDDEKETEKKKETNDLDKSDDNINPEPKKSKPSLTGALLKMMGFNEEYINKNEPILSEEINRIKQLLK